MKTFFSLLAGIVLAGNALAVTPADPSNVNWFDCDDESGYSRIYYSLPQVDTEGNPLNMENLGFRVFTDNDQLFTFEASVYTYDNLYVDQTEIYYWIYSNGTDFYPTSTYIYRTNYEGYDRFFIWRIGVQAVYINEDNTKTYSNIVYKEVFDAPEQPVEVKGDADGNGEVGIGDVAVLIDYLLGSESSINQDNADVDEISGLTISDVTALIDFLLGGHWPE